MHKGAYYEDNNGLILFSSYSSEIWKERLDWFRKQHQTGLLGEIDEKRRIVEPSCVKTVLEPPLLVVDNSLSFSKNLN
jgi:hypothetical protein